MRRDFCRVPRLGGEVASGISFDKGCVAALLNSAGELGEVCRGACPKGKQMLKCLNSWERLLNWGCIKSDITSWCIVLWVAATPEAVTVLWYPVQPGVSKLELLKERREYLANSYWIFKSL